MVDDMPITIAELKMHAIPCGIPLGLLWKVTMFYYHKNFGALLKAGMKAISKRIRSKIGLSRFRFSMIGDENPVSLSSENEKLALMLSLRRTEPILVSPRGQWLFSQRQYQSRDKVLSRTSSADGKPLLARLPAQPQVAPRNERHDASQGNVFLAKNLV